MLNRQILLINPAYSAASRAIRKSAWIAMPMGLLYLAAALENKGFSVKIIDLEDPLATLGELYNYIKTTKPFLIGITSTTPMINSALSIANNIKRIDQDIKVVLGGVHPSCLPTETLQSEAVDIVVKGEGEVTVAELAEALWSNSSTLENIKGLYYKKDNKIIFSGERPLMEDLDALSFPAWHLLNFGIYTHPLTHVKPIASILTSRGCPSSCTFCSRGVFGKINRRRSVENVLAEIKLLIERYNIREIHFIDDTFALSRSHVEGICRGIIQNKWRIRWATPNGINVNSVDLSLMKLMKESGCYSLSFGVESGNQETLNRVKKLQSLDKIEEVFNMCHALHIESIAFIIVGFPFEGHREINDTLTFLKKIKADVVDVHLLIPLPGTEIYKELEAKGYILEKDWSKYVFHNLPVYKTDYFSPKDLFREYKKLYCRYHLRPRFILSRLMRVRSWEQFKINLNGFFTLFALKRK